ncbi:MAG: hypothetical protein GXW85_08020 [Clostridia bacterium]|nr:hypothetical protein [Clostridia bacterium]
MKTPKFSRWVTIPAIFILNFLAWLYVYDDYMMSWIIVYPLFMVVAIAFTISAELAFGRDKKVRNIGINVGIILLLLIFAQRYFPMDQLESVLLDNYLAHIKADVQDLTPNDKAVRIEGGFSIVARNFEDNVNGQAQTILEVHKKGKLIDQITVTQAIEKIQEIIPQEKKGDFDAFNYNEARYVGLRKKGGNLNFTFTKGYVTFKYQLDANEQGFVWDPERYKGAGLTLPPMEGLYGDETNKKIKDILVTGDLERAVEVEITVKGDTGDAVRSLEDLGYKIINEDPVTLQIPFYEIANVSRLEYVQHFEIR